MRYTPCCRRGPRANRQPVPNGKVIVDTTAGEIEVSRHDMELAASLVCRNMRFNCVNL